jgi:hypothetical protein
MFRSEFVLLRLISNHILIIGEKISNIWIKNKNLTYCRRLNFILFISLLSFFNRFFDHLIWIVLSICLHFSDTMHIPDQI